MLLVLQVSCVCRLCVCHVLRVCVCNLYVPCVSYMCVPYLCCVCALCVVCVQRVSCVHVMCAMYVCVPCVYVRCVCPVCGVCAACVLCVCACARWSPAHPCSVTPAPGESPCALPARPALPGTHESTTVTWETLVFILQLGRDPDEAGGPGPRV